jgi:hypothetical protein
MLEKFLNQNVLICIANYASAFEKVAFGATLEHVQRRGKVTRVDENFVELDNNEVVAIKYICTIKSL